MRLATAPKIRTIDFARSGIQGTGSLSPKARRTLAVYTILAKMEFDGVSAPMGSISDAVWRSSNGEARSIRTLQRANKELTKAGFISIQNFRPDRWAVIRFNLEAFSYWTGRKSKGVSPIPTPSHPVSPDTTIGDKSAYATTCHPSDRTRDNVRVNSSSPNTSIDKEPRAGARANKKPIRPKKNPVLFSLMAVLAKQDLYRAAKRKARSRAEVEVKAMSAGIELLNPSGVDWQYWESRWSQFSIARRENTVRVEILPYLIGRNTLPTQNVKMELPPIETQNEIFSPKKEDIRLFRESLEKAFPDDSASKPLKKDLAQNPSQTQKETTLSEEDMRILLGARSRINGV